MPQERPRSGIFSWCYLKPMNISRATCLTLGIIAALSITNFASAQRGRPDLQGNWINQSATPLQRPRELEGRQSLSGAEVAELKRRAKRIFAPGKSDIAPGDEYFLALWRNPAQFEREASIFGGEFREELQIDSRTSLVVDPVDGRLPPYTPEGQRRQAEAVAATLNQNHPASVKDLANAQRCLTWGVPILVPSSTMSHYQILQTADYVVLVMEAVHDARIIPLDGRPHPPAAVRFWNGDSLGRWEDQTLVVDTTNFSAQSNFMGSAENLHLVERFTRIAPDEISYEVLLHDPTTWTRPWKAVIRLRQTQDKIYEMACHEGNFRVVQGILTPGRP